MTYSKKPKSRQITWNNRTQSLRAWAAELGVSCNTLWNRKGRRGLEYAMTAPAPKHLPQIEWNGKSQTIIKWAKELGYRCENFLQARIAKHGLAAAMVMPPIRSNALHGLSKIPEYRIFDAMKSRCNNPNHPQYKDYGGRGIKCEYASFADFIEDVGRRPRRDLTIDRIDNNGNYTHSNCAWVSRKANSRNMRNNCYLTHLGQKKLLIDWAALYNIKAATLYARIKAGWETMRAFVQPVQKRDTPLKNSGITEKI